MFSKVNFVQSFMIFFGLSIAIFNILNKYKASISQKIAYINVKVFGKVDKINILFFASVDDYFIEKQVYRITFTCRVRQPRN